MKKDKEWLKEELLGELMQFNDNPNMMTSYETGIADGIVTAINLTEKLDEPQKPVIPQFVADFIEKWKCEGLTIYEWLSFGNNDVDEDVYKWLYNNLNEKNIRREYLLIDAIRNGYEVEKEKLYRVRAGNRYVRFNLDGSIIGVKKDNSIVCLERLAKLPFDYKKAVESGIITLEEVTE